MMSHGWGVGNANAGVSLSHLIMINALPRVLHLLYVIVRGKNINDTQIIEFHHRQISFICAQETSIVLVEYTGTPFIRRFFRKFVCAWTQLHWIRLGNHFSHGVDFASTLVGQWLFCQIVGVWLLDGERRDIESRDP
jgi:hypothetical protein